MLPNLLIFFVNHIHNDYLEILLDMGIFGILIIAGLFFIYINRWKQVWQDKPSSFKLIKTGAGVGIVLALLYSLTDFGLHTPANAVFFAFLFGVFLHKEQLTQTNLSTQHEQTS